MYCSTDSKRARWALDVRGTMFLRRPPFTHVGSVRALAGRADAWSVLGVQRGEDLADVKAAFRKLALALHPDVASGTADATRFAAVIEAYEAISQGRADDERPGPRPGGGPRAARVVGGVLVVSIDELKRDPDYTVHTVRLVLDGDDKVRAGGADAACAARLNVEWPAAEAGALGRERVHEVRAHSDDSVGDLRISLQSQLELPTRLQHGGRQRGGLAHELIAAGQLLGEHLFLRDYGLRDGATVHFAVRSTR